MAILDYDNDGLMDLFFVNGDRLGDKAGESRHYLWIVVQQGKGIVKRIAFSSDGD